MLSRFSLYTGTLLYLSVRILFLLVSKSSSMSSANISTLGVSTSKADFSSNSRADCTISLSSSSSTPSFSECSIIYFSSSSVTVGESFLMLSNFNAPVLIAMKRNDSGVSTIIKPFRIIAVLSATASLFSLPIHFGIISPNVSTSIVVRPVEIAAAKF